MTVPVRLKKKFLYLLLEDITIRMYYFRVWWNGVFFFFSEGYVREINFAKNKNLCSDFKLFYFVIVKI